MPLLDKEEKKNTIVLKKSMLTISQLALLFFFIFLVGRFGGVTGLDASPCHGPLATLLRAGCPL